MGRNLVLCADGTCNAFGHSGSNVAKLLEYIELQQKDAQVVCYDQGIGTRRSQHRRITEFSCRLGNTGALHPLPHQTTVGGTRRLAQGDDPRARIGYKRWPTVRVAFEAMRPEDRVFLFGFSRGAFTVRALAGFSLRYGIPATNDSARGNAIFSKAWPMFVDEFSDEDGVKTARAQQFHEEHGQRLRPIHFLGLWDTVKSYGGIGGRVKS